jgi:hypothetical protein
MRKTMIFLSCAFFIGCHQSSSFQEQLDRYLAEHIKKLDTLVVLDSIRITQNIAVNQKLGAIIDDSIYMREYTRLKAQLAVAAALRQPDSMAYYRDEIHYMDKELDSIGRSIGRADTSSNFGHLIDCRIFISKLGRLKTDSVLLFMDSSSTLRFPQLMDSFLKKSLNNFK